MARVRSDKREKAKNIWLKSDKSKKLKDIAQELQVSESQIRKWKSIDKWDKVTLPLTKPKKSDGRGAPKGNKNAVGNKGGAPKGNKNHLVTGEFEKIFFDTLTIEEINLINSMEFNKVEELNREIALLTVRERRILKRIDSIKDSKLVLDSVTTVKVKGEDGDITGESSTTNTSSNLNIIMSLEDSLTRIQTQKIKAIESLARIEESIIRLELETGGNNDDINTIENWLEAVNPTDDEVSKLFAEVVEYEEV